MPMNGLLAKRMARAGRYGDNEVGHLKWGEVVVPETVLNQGDTRSRLRESFDRAGRDFGRYEVGGMDDSRNPVTGAREFYDSYGGEDPSGNAGVGGGVSAPGPAGAGDAPDGGDWGGAMDSGPVSTGFDFGQAQKAQDAVSMADFGRDMDSGPVSQTFNPEQYERAQAWGDYNRGYNVAKHMPFGLGLFAKAINWGVQRGHLPEPMTRAELREDQARWDALGPMAGSGEPTHAKYLPQNGLAPSMAETEPRRFFTPAGTPSASTEGGPGFFTPAATGEPPWVKYLRPPETT